MTHLLFDNGEARFQLSEGTAQRDRCTVRVQVRGPISCDFDGPWASFNLDELERLLVALRDAPQEAVGMTVDGDRSVGLRVLAVENDPDAGEDEEGAISVSANVWMTPSMSDPALGVTFWMAFEWADDLEAALESVAAVRASIG